MTNLVSQLTFDGREITGIVVETPIGEMDLGELSVPDGFEDYVPSNGDEWELRLRVRVGPAKIGANYDRTGTAKDTYRRSHKLQAVEEGFAVTAIVLRAEKEKLWALQHGAQEAQQA